MSIVRPEVFVYLTSGDGFLNKRFRENRLNGNPHLFDVRFSINFSVDACLIRLARDVAETFKSRKVPGSLLHPTSKRFARSARSEEQFVNLFSSLYLLPPSRLNHFASCLII